MRSHVVALSDQVYGTVLYALKVFVEEFDAELHVVGNKHDYKMHLQKPVCDEQCALDLMTSIVELSYAVLIRPLNVSISSSLFAFLNGFVISFRSSLFINLDGTNLNLMHDLSWCKQLLRQIASKNDRAVQLLCVLLEGSFEQRGCFSCVKSPVMKMLREVVTDATAMERKNLLHQLELC